MAGEGSEIGGYSELYRTYNLIVTFQNKFHNIYTEIKMRTGQGKNVQETKKKNN